MIYLASPYSDPSFAVRELRYRLAMKCCAHFISKKVWLYSPIVHCHDMALHHKLPIDHKFWQEYNEDTILSCKHIYILAIPGWRESRGVASEINFTSKLRFPITLVDPSDYKLQVLQEQGHRPPSVTTYEQCLPRSE